VNAARASARLRLERITARTFHSFAPPGLPRGFSIYDGLRSVRPRRTALHPPLHSAAPPGLKHESRTRGLFSSRQGAGRLFVYALNDSPARGDLCRENGERGGGSFLNAGRTVASDALVGTREPGRRLSIADRGVRGRKPPPRHLEMGLKLSRAGRAMPSPVGARRGFARAGVDVCGSEPGASRCGSKAQDFPENRGRGGCHLVTGARAGEDMRL
jgi:hypothetical protein